METILSVRRFVCLSIAVVMVASARPLPAQGLARRSAQGAVAAPVAANGVSDPFSGTWTYRSFLSNPDLNAEPNNLLFGSGTLSLSLPAPDRLAGTLGGEGWQLVLRGGVTHGNPATIRFQGKGIIGTEEWVYDYLGYLVPIWPNGENQRPAIVGTIVRTAPHSNGRGGISPAGVVAQWIAVKQDDVQPTSRTDARRAPAANPSAALAMASPRSNSSGLIRRNPPEIHEPFGGLYSHGVEVPAGYRTLYVAGQVGVSQTGSVPADPGAQMDLAWNNLKHVLAASGMTLDDVVKVNCYLADEKYAADYARSVVRHFGKDKPAMTAPIVRRLWSPDWYVEIDATAAKADDNSRRTLGSPAPVRSTAEAAPAAITSDVAPPMPEPPAMDLSPEAVRRGNEQLRELYQQQDQLERAREPARREGQNENLRKSTQRPAALAVPAVPDVATAKPSVGATSSLKPFTITSVNGRLDVTLNLDYHTFAIGKDRVRLRSYRVGGDRLPPQYPVGPVLRCKAGDTLYITLNNRLPLNPTGDSHGPNGHHQWNTTNLHFHGLHVAPQGPQDRPYGRSSAESDNVLIEIPPSKPFEPAISSQFYAVKIPADHPAGTFWYHAHKHGAVAAQVSSGLLGALIVERDPQDERLNLDSIREVAEAAQEVMVLQQIPYSAHVFGSVGGIEPTSPAVINSMFGPGRWAQSKRYTLVNGLRIPTITMAPGEVRRLRLIHGGQREEILLKIKRGPTLPKEVPLPSLYEIALDGLASGLLHNRDGQFGLFPGYRSDVLLQAPLDGTGEFFLVDENVPEGFTGCDGSLEPVQQIVRIVVAGAPRKMSLPSTTELLKRRLPDLAVPMGATPQFAFYGIDLFTLGGGRIGFMVSQKDLRPTTEKVIANVNSHAYSEGDTRLLERDRIDQWVIGSRNGPSQLGGTTPLAVTHPFHIHINPFLITRITDAQGTDVTKLEFGGPVWRDTLAMRQGYTYELVTKYETFTGSFVDHCHILDHEDQGMMELVTICDRPRTSQQNSPLKNRIGLAPTQEKGKASVLLFVKDSLCPHCMAQLVGMAGKLKTDRMNVSVISNSTVNDLNDFPAVPFTLVADPESRIFKQYGVFEGESRHGTLAFDATGKEVLRVIGDQPLMDAAVILRAVKPSPGSKSLAGDR